MMKLRQTLDGFLTHGLEDFPALMTFCAKKEEDDDCLQLEESWRKLINKEKLKELNKKQTDLQEAIWEIIQTEATYIKDLRIVVDLYLCTLVNLQGAMMLNDIETEKIFANISAIESIHARFWKEKLSGVVKKARREGGLLSVSDMADAFKDFFTDIKTSYDEFNRVLYRCMKYLSDWARDSGMFCYYLDWGRSHPKSRGLELKDLLDYPMTRITSYPALLAKVEKTLDGCKDVKKKISKIKQSATSLSDQLREARERQMDELFKNLHSPKEEKKDRVLPGSSPGCLKKRLTLKENDKLLQLQQTLDDFMTHGLQDFSGLCMYGSKKDENENFLDIEDSWRDFVDKEKLPDLGKGQTAQQDAIWDIFTTEVSFLKDIRIVSDLYLCALVNLQGAMIFNEIETEKIFDNISEIEELHQRFWKDRLLSSVVLKCRANKTLPSVMDLVEAFEGFEELFEPYLDFGTCRTECQGYFREQAENNNLFQCFLKWAERHPKSRGLKLEDLLDLPFQHMAKYLSLIFALEKTLDDQEKSELVLRTFSQAKGFVIRVLEKTGRSWNEPNVHAEEITVKTSLRRKAAMKLHRLASNGNPKDLVPASDTKSKMTKLRQSLDHFMVHGLEDFPGLLTFDAGRDDDKACLQIEESWRCIVETKTIDKLTKQQIDQQDAIWNLITREVSYIKNLRIVTDLFRRALINLQGAMILNEIETEKIFANFSTIEKLHTKFWTEKLSKVFGNAREENRLLDVADLAEAYSGFASFSASYIRYFAFRSGCKEYLEEQIRHNKPFIYFLEWGRRHPTNHELSLQDLLEYPVQYINEYPNLLTAVEKSLDRGELVLKRISEAKGVSIKICQESTRLLEGRSLEEQGAVGTKRSEETAERSPTIGSNSFVPVSKVEPGKLVKLKETLDEFMTHGFQEFPGLLCFGTDRKEDKDDCQIGDCWRSLIDSETVISLSENAVAQQDAIWSIIASEASYIKNIRLVLDMYLCALVNLQGAILLNEIETEKIFGNISTIEKLHTRFWKEKLSGVVKRAREEQQLLSVADLVEAFEKFPDLLYPYVRYCTDNSANLAYLREQTQTNEMFGVYIEWAERHPESRGLKLHELLRFPCQRVTEYQQLFSSLEKTLKTSDDSDSTATPTKIAELKEKLLEFSIGLTTVLEKRLSTNPKTAARTQHTSPDGLDGSRMLKLRQALDDFMINGLQDFPGLLTFCSKEEGDDGDECFEIEDSWRAFVDEGEMSKNQADLQDAMWEMIASEAAYIKNIRIITNLYLCTLVNLQAAMLLNEIETETVFSNISTIEKRHTKFWKEKLLRLVQRARQEKRPISTSDFIRAFEGFSIFMHPYIRFCGDNKRCLDYLREQTKSSEMFKVFLEWTQNHPKNRGHELQDLLACPIQRISGYPVLLSEVEKAVDVGGSKEEVSQKISEIKEFVKQIQKEPRQTYSRRLKSDEILEARRSFRRKKGTKTQRPYSEGSLPVFAPASPKNKMVKLQQILDEFTIYGLQDFPGLLAFDVKKKEDKDPLLIETSWRILANKEDLSRLSKKQVNQQVLIWEILLTEATYIQNLRIIVDFYFCALLNLQSAGFLNEIETETIFQNISSLEKLHTRFWKEKLSKVVENAKLEGRLPSARDLLTSFEGFARLCAPYAKYCARLDECLRYLRDNIENNKLLRHFLEWAEGHPKSQGFKLHDLLRIPVLHIERYPTLLQHVDKTQGDQDRVDISETIAEMKTFLGELHCDIKHL